MEEATRLLQEALEKRGLIEIHSPDGRTLIVNPLQVQYLQNAADLEVDQ